MSEIQWKVGDRLRIAGMFSPEGRGLSYAGQTVIAVDPGTAGGWDVYDARTDDGAEISFYGFSVRRKLRV